MATHVVERAQLALLIAHQNDALAADIDHAMIARPRQLFLATDAHPFAVKDMFLFQREDIVSLVPESRQGRFEAGQCGIHRHLKELLRKWGVGPQAPRNTPIVYRKNK